MFLIIVQITVSPVPFLAGIIVQRLTPIVWVAHIIIQGQAATHKEAITVVMVTAWLVRKQRVIMMPATEDSAGRQEGDKSWGSFYWWHGHSLWITVMVIRRARGPWIQLPWIPAVQTGKKGE